VIALAGLLVTAGCLGLLGDATTPDPTATESSSAPTVATEPSTTSPTASPPSTETPPAGTTASPTPAAIVRSSEVNEAGIGSAERVADAHHARLRNTSFTVRHASHRTRNGTITYRVSGTIRYGDDGTTHYNYTAVDVNAGTTVREHVEVWSNGTTARRAITTENGTVVEEIPPIETPPTFADQVEIYFRSFPARMTGYSRFGGESVVRLAADGLDLASGREQYTVEDRARWIGITELHGGQFSADLAGDAVRRYHLRLSGHGPNGSISMTRELVFTRVGSTTIHRPAWVTAGNATRSG
jgi:hypothetical protein